MAGVECRWSTFTHDVTAGAAPVVVGAECVVRTDGDRLSVVQHFRDLAEDSPRFRAYWEEAAKELGLDVRFAFELTLGAGVRARVPVLLRDFGGPKGMLIVPDEEYGRSISDEWLEEAVRAGYGFSVMSEPSTAEEFDREVVMEVLADWGWNGAESDKPAWLDRLSGG